ILVLALAHPLAAFQAKPGYVKVELTWANTGGAPIPAAELTAGLGAEDVGDYGRFRLVALPATMVTALRNRAAAAGMQVRVRDELDRIETPSASIDVRAGIRGAPLGGLISGYPETRTGLYLLQLAGPAKTEWYDALRHIGWTIAGYLPSDAYIVAGR